MLNFNKLIFLLPLLYIIPGSATGVGAGTSTWMSEVGKTTRARGRRESVCYVGKINGVREVHVVSISIKFDRHYI